MSVTDLVSCNISRHIDNLLVDSHLLQYLQFVSHKDDFAKDSTRIYALCAQVSYDKAKGGRGRTMHLALISRTLIGTPIPYVS
jgi:hypothetical protein